MSTADLRAELDRRERQLERERDRLLAELAALDAQIGRRGPGRPRGSGRRGPGRPRGSGRRRLGAPTGLHQMRRTGRGRRARNESNLVDALKKMLTGKTMSVTDATAKVQEAGYKTTSPNFRTIVNAALLKKANFKRVSRGQYTAK